MEKIPNIYQRINAVMHEVSYIQKLDKKVNNMYKFVSHDQVTGTLHPVLAKHGIVMIPTIAEMLQDGNRTVAKVEIRFINMDDPKDEFKVTYIGYGIDTGDKGPGKAISYAVKYALLKTFCLETGDDPDMQADTKYEKEEEKPEEAEKKLKSFLKSHDVEDKDLIVEYMKKYADHYNKSIGETLQDHQDKEKFMKQLSKYREKLQQKSA